MDVEIKMVKHHTHAQPRWLTLVRVALGALLFWKGISFLQSQSTLEAMMQNMGIEIFSKNAQVLALLITYLHLLGGTFIAIGFLTRWAALVQIPILIGAVLFASFSPSMHVSSGEVVLSIIVLALSILFIVKGSGYFSTDEYFKSYYLRREEEID